MASRPDWTRAGETHARRANELPLVDENGIAWTRIRVAGQVALMLAIGVVAYVAVQL